MTRAWDMGRRDWLRLAMMGAIGGPQCGWLKALAADASPNSQRKKAVILLWMNGGPATIDLWDLKPGHENGGPFKAIDSAVPGVKLSEHLPKLSQWTKEMAIVLYEFQFGKRPFDPWPTGTDSGRPGQRSCQISATTCARPTVAADVGFPPRVVLPRAAYANAARMNRLLALCC